MFKCIKEYKRNGQLYSAGKEYDIKKAEIEIHEKQMGAKLWEGEGKDEAPETPAANGGDDGGDAADTGADTPPEAGADTPPEAGTDTPPEADKDK